VLRPEAECTKLVGNYCENLRHSSAYRLAQPIGAAMGLALDDEVFGADS
jgi:hypothetical protein